jgi:UDP-2,3-diacylglucosamine hydrolase
MRGPLCVAGNWRRPVSCAVPAQRLLVIADAHIGSAPKANEAALLRFLRQAPGMGDALLVAGDLFEFWFGWRRVIPRRGFAVAAALAEAAARMPVSMVGGNHDRWGRPGWTDDAGITWSRGQLDLQLGEKRLLALHGDGVAERAGRISWSHRIVGHPLTAATFGLLHPDLGTWLVDRLSPWLGELHSTPAQKAASAARQLDYARQRLATEPDPWMLVMGHTHLAAFEELSPGRYYLNPGPWIGEQCYAVVTADGARLRHF